MTPYTITIKNTIVWITIYFTTCGILPTVLNIKLWRNLGSMNSIWVNLLALIVSNSVFLFYLIKKYQFKVSIFNNTTINGILLAISCSILFFFLLDKFLDPFFDSIFIISAGRYQETILELQQAPIANFIRICLLAPIVEEILMRGFILNSLQNKYGMVIALLVSSLLFAILHFNFVQTLSAVICGLILGLLYINTGSLFCCILAHSLYNGISFFTSVLNFRL